MTVTKVLAPLWGVLAFSFAAVAPMKALADVASLVRMATGKNEGRTVVVLIDASSSIAPEDRSLYLASLRVASGGLRGGDRFLVARIGEATRSSFQAGIDITVNRKAARLDQEDEIKAAQARLSAVTPGLIAAKTPARNTRILEAIAATAPVFEAAHGAGSRLVLLTDGVEESGVLDLAKTSLNAVTAKQAIARLRSQGLIPNLQGVDLAVVGAGGKRYESVKAFWVAYAAATHSTLSQYDRLVLHPGR